jgi:hypothetical protein
MPLSVSKSFILVFLIKYILDKMVYIFPFMLHGECKQRFKATIPDKNLPENRCLNRYIYYLLRP